jgi:hypothetical protein
MVDIARTVATTDPDQALHLARARGGPGAVRHGPNWKGERHHERSRNEPFGCHHGSAGRACGTVYFPPRGELGAIFGEVTEGGAIGNVIGNP